MRVASGSASEGTRQARSPASPSASRLVARIRTRGPARSRASARCAQPCQEPGCDFRSTHSCDCVGGKRSRTCDRRLCERHRSVIRQGLTDTVDDCPQHALLYTQTPAQLGLGV